MTTTRSDCGPRMEWYRLMCLIRSFEQAVLTFSKGGLVPGTAHLYIGMEAIAVGTCSAMQEVDFLTSTHRGHGHCIARGLDVRRMLAEVLGKAGGFCRGKGGSMHLADFHKGMLGADGIVGGGIPVAVGAALGLRLKGNVSVVLCFFGDGAVNQGSFHEAVNFAAIRRLPVVFICENNLWALSGSFSEMTAGGSVARRALAYDIPGETVDGNDVAAVYQASAKAATRAREGLGPSLIECQSYRWESHSIFTRQEVRLQAEIEEWKRRDPIERCRKCLLETGIPIEAIHQIESEVAAEIDEAVEFAKTCPAPETQCAFEDVYA